MTTEHGQERASDWVQRWTHLVPRHGTVLDLACGYGRHLRWFAARGHPVVGVDRSQDALDALDDLGRRGSAQLIRADLENDPWPLMEQERARTFDAVVVTNYLWRPLLAQVVASLAPHGVLVYETFAVGNASVGKPSRPDFLLQPGELLQACASLRVIAYEDGFCDQPERFIQRIAAVKPDRLDAAAPQQPQRYRLC